MDYNAVEIGKRIRSERKAHKLSLEEIAERIGCRRETLGRWENGKVFPQLDALCRMCEIFDCELGYLLCEYDCKTRAASDICAETGLSEKAVSFLTSDRLHRLEINEFLSDMIEDYGTIHFLSDAYIDYKKTLSICNGIRQVMGDSAEEPGYIDSDGNLRLIMESKSDLDLKLFRCQNLFLKFVQKQENKKCL